MKVTRNLDDDSNQDPFFTLHNFKLSKANWQTVADKYKHDISSKALYSKTSKVIKNGGKEVDFKETMSVDISMDLKDEGTSLEPVNDDVFFLILHFEDKDFFGTDNIGRALVDLSLLLVDKNNLPNKKSVTHWFPILFQNNQIG